MEEQKKKWIPVLVAVIIAGAVLVWYISSGRSSLDLETREFVNGNGHDISEIDTSNPENILITCKNGEKYEIVFTQGQDNYDDLIFNACGEDGVVEE